MPGTADHRQVFRQGIAGINAQLTAADFCAVLLPNAIACIKRAYISEYVEITSGLQAGEQVLVAETVKTMNITAQ